jgi:hypothetical protein
VTEELGNNRALGLLLLCLGMHAVERSLGGQGSLCKPSVLT